MGARQTTATVVNGGQSDFQASGSSMQSASGRTATIPIGHSHPSPIPGASNSSSLSGLSYGLQYHRYPNRTNTPTSRHTDASSYGRQSNQNSDDSSPDDAPFNRFLLTNLFSFREDILTEDKGECSICLEDLKAGDVIARLPCLCIYHKSCIDEWFQVKRSCPEHPND